jgi:hypothetical protein
MPVPISSSIIFVGVLLLAVFTVVSPGPAAVVTEPNSDQEIGAFDAQHSVEIDRVPYCWVTGDLVGDDNPAQTYDADCTSAL